MKLKHLRNILNDQLIVPFTDVLAKRIELVSWVADSMKDPNNQVCNLIESRMNEVALKIKQTSTIFEADKLYSELSILEWISYVVCKAESDRLSAI